MFLKQNQLPRKSFLLFAGFLILLIFRVLEGVTPKPTYADLYVDLGIMSEKKGQPLQALEYYQKGMSQNPKSIYPFYFAGKTCGRLGDKEKELQYFYAVINLEPDLPKINERHLLVNITKREIFSETYFFIGEDLYLKGSYREALPFLKRAKSYDRGNEKNLFYLALVYYRFKDFPALIDVLTIFHNAQFYDTLEKISTLISPAGGPPLSFDKLKEKYSK